MDGVTRYLLLPADRTLAGSDVAADVAADVASGTCRPLSLDELRAYFPALESGEFASQSKLIWRYLLLPAAHADLPDWVWELPIPIVGVVDSSWRENWQLIRANARRCDAVLAVSDALPRLQLQGIANIFQFAVSSKLRTEAGWHLGSRDIDILGVLDDDLRLPSDGSQLDLLVDLSDQWQVRVVPESQCALILERARIVVNLSGRELPAVIGDAILAGATYLAPPGMSHPAFLPDSIGIVLRTSNEHVSHTVGSILASESVRMEQAKQSADQFAAWLDARSWRAIKSQLCSRFSEKFDRRLRTNHEVPKTRPANDHYFAALTELKQESPEWSKIAQFFQDAWLADPRLLLAGLGLAAALEHLGQPDFAVEQYIRVLSMANRIEEFDVDAALPMPRIFDRSIVQLWERVEIDSGDDVRRRHDAARTIIQGTVRLRLGKLTRDLPSLLLAHQVLPVAAAAEVGRFLFDCDRHRDAIEFLIIALRHSPFDNAIARMLDRSLLTDGRFSFREALLAKRGRLAKISGLSLIPPRLDPVADEPMSSHPLRYRIVWQGSIDVIHSLAHVNRELVSRLLDRNHSVAFQPAPLPDACQDYIAITPELETCRHLRIDTPDVHIRHHWPPDLTPPESGHWILIQPWEYGSVPSDWIEPLRNVDDVWVPSHFVRDTYLRAGLPEERVHVIPNGVSRDWIDRPKEPGALRTRKRTRFLFVGGTIHRKGFDVLLKVYRQTFSASDDVCLVIKDISASIYGNHEAPESIERFRKMPHSPEIEYLRTSLDEGQLCGLYDSCTCLVQPFRGEGFALPIVEAMARGLSVITTGLGPTLDYCSTKEIYLVPGAIAPFRERSVGDHSTVDFPFLVEPDQDMLRYYLRRVHESPDEARQMGDRAREQVRRTLTWDHSVQAIENRLAEVLDRPIVRFSKRNLAPSPAPMAPMPGVSLCMIVRNEEANLADCLMSVADLVDEMVIVDTGSTDTTREIAGGFKARVFDFPWVDSFAAARNESLRHARHEWIFWMDADDRLDDGARKAFREVRQGLTKDSAYGFVMKCLCLPDNDGVTTLVDHVRLFRNLPSLRWRYRIHEQILPAIREAGGDVAWTNVVIHHTGYRDPVIKSRKRTRDLRLLEIENAERPDDPFTLFNLGQVHNESGDTERALSFLRRSLALSRPSDSIVRKLYSLISQILRNTDRVREAFDTIAEGKRHYPSDPEILFQEALCRQGLNDWLGAADCYRAVLRGTDEQYFASSDPSLHGCKAHHNLAIALRELGDHAGCERHLQKALECDAGFTPSLAVLGECYLSQSRFTEVDEIVSQLLSRPTSQFGGEILDIRRDLAQLRHADAKAKVDSVIARYPDSLTARIILSHVCLQSRNWSAAEDALHEILRRDPVNIEAKQNLAILLRENAARS